MCASRSLIVNPIAGDTLVIDLESLAFKGRWILPNLVGGVDQMRDIDRAVLLKKSVTVVLGASTPPFSTHSSARTASATCSDGWPPRS